MQKVGGDLPFIAGPFVESTDNVKNNPESGSGETYEVMKRYRVFLPNAMKLNSAAGPVEDYVLWVVVAPLIASNQPFHTRGLQLPG